MHFRMKHVEIDFHFVHEKVLQGNLTIRHISTNDQITDIFTKNLRTQHFQMLKNKLTITTNPFLLRV